MPRADLLHDLPPNCIAMCVLSPRDCPIRCGDIVTRAPDGFAPVVDLNAPTLTSIKWQGAALFEVRAIDLRPEDWALWRANEARNAANGAGWTYGPFALANIIERARRIALEAAEAAAELERVRGHFGMRS